MLNASASFIRMEFNSVEILIDSVECMHFAEMHAFEFGAKVRKKGFRIAFFVI